MSRVAVPVALILLMVVGCFAEFAYFFPQLPAVVASHFNGQGLPDARMPKDKFAAFMGTMFAIMCLGTIALPLAVRYLPASTINLPQKDFWLAPERADTTRRMLVERTLWFWTAIWLFLWCLSHGTLQVNLGQALALPMVGATIFMVGFVVVWTGELIWRFSRTD